MGSTSQCMTRANPLAPCMYLVTWGGTRAQNIVKKLEKRCSYSRSQVFCESTEKHSHSKSLNFPLGAPGEHQQYIC